MSTENTAASQNQIIADIVAKRLEERLEGVRETAGKIAAISAKVAHSLAPEVLAESVTRRLLGEQEPLTPPFSTKAKYRLEDSVRDLEFFARSMRRELEVIGLLENRDAEFAGVTPKDPRRELEAIGLLEKKDAESAGEDPGRSTQDDKPAG